MTPPTPAQLAARNVAMAQELIHAAARLVYLPIDFGRASDVLRAVADALEER